MLFFHVYFSKDISKQGDLILMSQFLIHGENGVSFHINNNYARDQKELQKRFLLINK